MPVARRREMLTAQVWDTAKCIEVECELQKILSYSEIAVGFVNARLSRVQLMLADVKITSHAKGGITL